MSLITRRFQCEVCSRVAEYNSAAAPGHCGRPMRPGDVMFHGTDVKSTRIHFIKLLPRNAERLQVDWHHGATPIGPDGIREIWKCKVGRLGGEQLGYICDRGLFWEWVAVPGIAIRHGTAPTLNQAVQALMAAVEGGIHTKRNIERVAGSQPAN